MAEKLFSRAVVPFERRPGDRRWKHFVYGCLNGAIVSVSVIGALIVATSIDTTRRPAGPDLQIAEEAAPPDEAVPLPVITDPGAGQPPRLAVAPAQDGASEPETASTDETAAETPAPAAAPAEDVAVVSAAGSDPAAAPEATAIVVARGDGAFVEHQAGEGPARPDPGTARLGASLAGAVDSPRAPESYTAVQIAPPVIDREPPVMIEVPAMPRSVAAVTAARDTAPAAVDEEAEAELASAGGADVDLAGESGPGIPGLTLDGPVVAVSASTGRLDRAEPLLAVVLSDAGSSELTPEMLSALSVPLTIGIVPGTERAAEMAAAARGAGYEVLAQLPIRRRGAAGEAAVFGLSPEMSPEAVAAETDALIAALPDAVAVSNLTDERAGRTSPVVASLMEELDRRGMAYVENRAGPGGSVGRFAEDLGLSYAAATRVIPGQASADAIYRALNGAAREAQLRGSVVVIGPANRTMLEATLRWGLERGGRAARLVPVSEILARK